MATVGQADVEAVLTQGDQYQLHCPKHCVLVDEAPAKCFCHVCH